MACLENVGGVLPLPDPKLVVLDYWGIFAYFCYPSISLSSHIFFSHGFIFLFRSPPQFLISGANACSWWDGEWLLHNYSAFWHLDRHSPAVVTHWFRFRISVGSVGIHHSEEDSDPSFLGGEDLGSIIFWWEKSSIHHFWGGGGGECGDFGLECLPSVPFLPSCCHHLDPVVLLTCRRKEKKHLDLLPPLLPCHLPPWQ